MKNEKDSFGDRMKSYEDVNRFYLTRRTPLIIRVDGKSFHTFTKKAHFQKPFDKTMMTAMIATGKGLIDEIQGAKLVYIQSDEISVLATDYDSLETSAWFDKNLQKMVSVSASVATASFNRYMLKEVIKPFDLGDGLFDSRAFTLPKEEVCNYFIWRQKDATRNSIQGLGQSLLPHKSIMGLNNDELQEKMFQEKQINWNDLDVWKKRGICLYKRQVTKNIDGQDCVRTEIVEDWEIPIFTQNRNYIEKWV